METSGSGDSKTIREKEHIPCAAALKVTSTILPEWDLPVEGFFGEDCVDKFLDRLLELRDRLMKAIKTETPMKIPDDDTISALKRNPICCICNKVLKGKMNRDHCHYTGM